MGKRGPKSAEPKLTVLKPVQKRRPNPLPGMRKNARSVWLRIVGAYPPGHFKPQQYDLLRAYCEAALSHKNAVKEIDEQGEVITQPNGVIKENPWVGTMVKMTAIMQGLSVKLQISCNATAVTKGEAGESSKPKSKRAGLIFNG